jgi:hypothetical protein
VSFRYEPGGSTQSGSRGGRGHPLGVADDLSTCPPPASVRAMVVANARKAFRGCAENACCALPKNPMVLVRATPQGQSAAIAPGGDIVTLFDHAQRGVGVLVADVPVEKAVRKVTAPPPDSSRGRGRPAYSDSGAPVLVFRHSTGPGPLRN